MKTLILTIYAATFLLSSCNPKEIDEKAKSPATSIPEKVVLVIHGGAGTITRESMDSATENAYRLTLSEALEAGYSVIRKGGESCEATMQAIIVMENSPLFNAGVGAVFTAAGENELDASIMRGNDRSAGAVAGVKTIKNPILAANEVMVNSEHVMLSGIGAEQFAGESGLEMVAPGYFATERRKQQLEEIKRVEKEHGTVGAVALDQSNNLCAGTSTGGMTNKKYGRIGDSPIIGAGTYADNATCGVSATGHGEFFIRSVTAYEVAAQMKYKGLSVKEAAAASIQATYDLGGEGGLIALDTAGNVAMPFSSEGMYRGYVTESGKMVIQIYKD